MIDIFTARENDVLAAMLASATEQGHTQHRAIADRLIISERTVQTYLDRMFRKAGVGDKTALAVWAMRQGGTEGQNAARDAQNGVGGI